MNWTREKISIFASIAQWKMHTKHVTPIGIGILRYICQISYIRTQNTHTPKNASGLIHTYARIHSYVSIFVDTIRIYIERWVVEYKRSHRIVRLSYFNIYTQASKRASTSTNTRTHTYEPTHMAWCVRIEFSFVSLRFKLFRVYSSSTMNRNARITRPVRHIGIQMSFNWIYFDTT